MANADLLQQAPTKACHNCRRRRLRCDRSYPSCHKCTTAGHECLGYGKLYKWADGVASRGKLAGKSSAACLLSSSVAPHRASSSVTALPSNSSSLLRHANKGGTAARSHAASAPSAFHEDPDPGHVVDTQLCRRSPPATPGHAHGVPSTPWVLVDPIFQDIDQPYRYYLSYFTTRLVKDLVSHDLPDRNPFRSLIPLTQGNPLLQHVIVAASAAHLSNLTKPSMAAIATHDASGMVIHRSEEASRRALMDSLVAKQKALRLLNEALQNMDNMGSDVILAAVLFFINVELIESGKHGWKAHLEGAGRIMAFLPPAEPSTEFLRDYILSDCFIYYILASAFMPNTAATADASYFQSVEARSILQRATANSYLCCPPEILEILLAAAQLSNANTDDEVSATFVTETGVQLLARAQSFDIRAWANDVLTVTYLAHIPIESRIHAGSAHAMAACLYLLQAIPVVRHHLPANTQDLFERELMHHLSSIPDDDPNFKATTFPTFIAGAETRDPIKQAWVMDRLQRLLRNTPWGFIYTAMEALPQIWSLADDNSLGWVQTLKDPKMNFLIIESYCT
ncbi:hypothetical protein VDGE_05342 [Verticillium dahliae]|uniref:Zn(2)-C6 fungal-type domain-containing protein n=1 Tax=Verticillium dahliae TaxID=27337 RepID=A0A444RTV7_VERDA|nr:hypothetical protein VDGE_05342 [Verticillium dahliae]